MRRAAEAQKSGNLSDAISLISQAIKAAEGFESQLVRSLCWRAELLNQLERWQDAFNDASEAVRLSGGLARAHAARGTAAVKLGLLAEAVSSWETAEILGGVPEAAQEAEKMPPAIARVLRKRASRPRC
jgi:tetratricopeptide (TPR) repeat protein